VRSCALIRFVAICHLDNENEVTGCQMKTSLIALQDLVRVIKKQKIVTIEELKERLGTTAERTLYRKLKQASYRTSYTHGGGYFTLSEIAKFNKDGLWCCDSVWFSRHGTLLATLEAWVNQAGKGFYAMELENALHVSVKETLLYCSMDVAVQKRQLSARRIEQAQEEPTDELKAAVLLFFAVLDEQQRRLFAGLESLRHGTGADPFVAELFGVNVHTVAKGRKQLLDRDIETERTRKAGGGRKPIKKKSPKS